MTIKFVRHMWGEWMLGLWYGRRAFSIRLGWWGIIFFKGGR